MLLYSNKSIVIIGFLVAMFYSAPVHSQVGKNERPKVREADKKFEFGDYRGALKIYKEYLDSKKPDKDLYYKVGVCMYHLKSERAFALPYFEKSIDKNNIETDYYLGNLYHLTSQFEEALLAYNRYKNYPGEKLYSNEEISFLVKKTMVAIELTGNPENISIENAGVIINSEYPDYVPLLSADESIMIFTSRRKGSTGNLLDPNGDYFEDIYISKKINGAWSGPVSISNNINSSTHDACIGLAAGGENLFVYRTNKDETAGDIYLSKFDGNDWSAPELLGSDINTDKYLEPSACISADEEILYFSSNRPGGFGGMDIYKVVKLPDGTWSRASNLGAPINTPYDDDAPFIHPDGRKLYFSSRGHKNMGGYDIFRSELSDFGKWSDPVNLGFPVNTVDDDIYFVLSVNGDKGYYSSNKVGGIGGTDIYLIKMPEANFDLSVVTGKVLSSDTKIPLHAEITLINEEGRGNAEVYRSNKATGKFIVIVSKNKKYKILVEADGYYPNTMDINLSNEGIEVIMDPNKKDR